MAICGDGGFTMTPHVLCTAVEYDIPCVWVIWNNFAWGAIRDIQHGLFGGREYATGFYAGENRAAVQPGLRRAGARAWCRAASPSRDLADLAPALEAAVRSNKPWVLDVHVDANVRPPSTGTWSLPPTRIWNRRSASA